MSAPTATAAATAATETTPEQEIQARIESLQSNLKGYMDSQKTVLKDMVSTLGQIQKLFAKTVRSKGKSRRRVSPPQYFKLEAKTAKSFAKLGLKGDTFTRSELMKSVSAYVRAHNLQKEINGKKTGWSADATLAKVLGISKGSVNTYLQINEFVTPIIKASTKVSAPTESA
jgi:chromatin remodeling complex protein RSC6